MLQYFRQMNLKYLMIRVSVSMKYTSFGLVYQGNLECKMWRLPGPGRCDAQFPGRVAFALGFAGPDHPGVFFCHGEGLAIFRKNPFFLWFFDLEYLGWGELGKGNNP
jgi:hypothetical protein